jgi:uncharacterized caspase-like protein
MTRNNRHLFLIFFLFLTLQIFGKSPRVFAVIVGISDYKGTAVDLKYSDDDARLFHTYLLKAMPGETSSGRVVLLLNSQASKSAILSSLRNSFKLATPDDFIIFYFSGHGSKGNFIPYDYQINTISHNEIKQIFKNTQAAYRIFIADACFSGSISNGNAINNEFNAMNNLKDNKMGIIMSSKPNQMSRESHFMKQGLFSYYLIRGLTGYGDLNKDGYITVGELFIYTKNNTIKASKGTQVPLIFGNQLEKIPLAKIRK